MRHSLDPRPAPGTLILLAALALASLAAQAAAAGPPADVEFTPDVVYGKGGERDLTLDLSRPKGRKPGDAPLPCVLVIHGGGWGAGNKAAHRDITWALAKKGYVAATVGYRFAPEHRFPAQVEDVKCAARFLRAHADKYGIDPDRLGAVGFSAGAHLSMMLGLTSAEDKLEGEGGWGDQSSRVQAVVAFFGPTDLAADDIPQVTRPIIEKLIGGTPAEKAEQFRRASPIHYVGKGDAPMLLFQGTADTVVPATQATRMAEAMHKANLPGRVELLIGAGHGWGGEELRRTGDAAFAFFTEHLTRK